MVWVVVNKDGSEIISEVKPIRSNKDSIWTLPSRYSVNYGFIKLPKGSIRKLIGRNLTWSDDPVKLVSSEVKPKSSKKVDTVRVLGFDKFKSKFIEAIQDNCYHYNGIRYHDIGLVNNFIHAINLFGLYVNKRFDIHKVSDQVTSSGGFSNVANSRNTWKCELVIKDHKFIIKGTWVQIGGASIDLDGKTFIEASCTSYGSWVLNTEDTLLRKLYDIIYK